MRLAAIACTFLIGTAFLIGCRGDKSEPEYFGEPTPYGTTSTTPSNASTDPITEIDLPENAVVFRSDQSEFDRWYADSRGGDSLWHLPFVRGACASSSNARSEFVEYLNDTRAPRFHVLVDLMPDDRPYAFECSAGEAYYISDDVVYDCRWPALVVRVDTGLTPIDPHWRGVWEEMRENRGERRPFEFRVMATDGTFDAPRALVAMYYQGWSTVIPTVCVRRPP